jgi:hypothetical protein
MSVHARRAQNRAAKVRREVPPGAINNEGVSAVMKRDDASPRECLPNFSLIESAAREFSGPLARSPIDVSHGYRIWRIPSAS